MLRLQDLGHDSDSAGDVLFYTAQVSKLLRPVLWCIILSILWTKISIASTDFRPSSSAWTVYRETESASSGERFVGGLANAGIMLAQIVVMTMVLLLLYKFNCMKAVYAIFGIVLVVLLGFTSLLVCLCVTIYFFSDGRS
jgi:presenilin 1